MLKFKDLKNKFYDSRAWDRHTFVGVVHYYTYKNEVDSETKDPNTLIKVSNTFEYFCATTDTITIDDELIILKEHFIGMSFKSGTDEHNKEMSERFSEVEC